MRRRGRRNRLRKNPAALFAIALVLISGFLFPLFSFSIFGEDFSDKSGVVVNLVIDLFSKKYSFTETSEFVILFMVLSYLVIATLYLLNGLGIIYNRYSRYASFLSFAYLLLGLIAVVLLNRQMTIPFFGNTVGSMTIGLGTYLLPIVGILYLIFHRQINSMFGGHR
ncbi:MAG: hypothetical protein Q7S06_01900 [Nanoarchaeota archaeon]|nr:hypothetical protein [Nanoarchaeota archaeon]